MGRHEKKPAKEISWRQILVDFLVSFFSGLALWLIDKITE